MTPAERAEQIARFRNMAQGDPDDDLAHFRLGQMLAENGQHDEAITALERTIAINPGFSRAYLVLGESLIQSGQKDKAIEVITKGWHTAEERGDRIPKDAMTKVLVTLGAPVPASTAPKAEEDDGPGTGFRCQRPGCTEGKRARQLPAPPLPDAIGERIQRDICAACWTMWWKDTSVKVINEGRLDLSSEFHQQEYDRAMRDFMGFEEEPNA